MHLDLDWRPHSGTEDHAGIRSAAGFLVAALGVGAVLLVLEFGHDTRVFSDLALADLLLTKHGVATVPGSAFGAPGHLRISYAAGMEHLQEAIGRIKAAVEAA